MGSIGDSVAQLVAYVNSLQPITFVKVIYRRHTNFAMCECQEGCWRCPFCRKIKLYPINEKELVSAALDMQVKCLLDWLRQLGLLDRLGGPYSPVTISMIKHLHRLTY